MSLTRAHGCLREAVAQGLIRRIADRLDPMETRAAEPSWAALRGWQSAAGQRVDPGSAEGLSVVLSCVGAISGALASLPAFVYRRVAASQSRLPITRSHA